MSSPEDWPGAEAFGAIGGQPRPIADGGTDPLADLEDLTIGQTAVLLAVRHVGPVNRCELTNRGVVSNGTTYGATAELIERGLLERADPVIPNKPVVIYDPVRQERPTVPILPDGGTIRRGHNGGQETVEAKATMPQAMLRALDDFVDAGAYMSRSEAIRNALRRELRRTSADPDDLSRAVQELYEYILLGDRPEAVAQCEQVAGRLGVSLNREVLR